MFVEMIALLVKLKLCWDDLCLCVDVTLDVDMLTFEQEIEINSFAHQYGMKEEDFVT